MAGEEDVWEAVEGAELAGEPEERPVLPIDRTCKGLLLNDIGNGERLIARFGRDLLSHPALGWLAWTGTHWDDQLGLLLARRRAQETARAIFAEARAFAAPDETVLIDELVAAGLRGKELDKAVKARLGAFERKVGRHRAWAVSSGNSGKLSAMLTEAQPHLTRPPESFDADPFVFNAANKTLELRPDGTFRALPHRREDLITKVGGCDFVPGAAAPHFTAMLETIQPDPAMRQFLQRWAGYLLTGSIGEQVMTVFHGDGSNGKGTLMNAWRAVLGGFAITVNIESFGEGSRRDGSSASPDIARMRGARMIATSDAPSNFVLGEGMIKQATGEEPMNARKLHADFLEFWMRGKVTIPCNPRPRIAGTDHGIWRRVLLVPFTVQITKDDVLAFRRAHGDLTALLRAEASGILNWMLEGYRAWRVQGLSPPPAVLAATEDYRHESDPVGEFLQVWTERLDGCEASSAALFEKYGEYCKANGMGEPKSVVSFGKALKNHGLESRKSRGVKRWVGLLLREVPKDDPAKDEAVVAGPGPRSDAGMVHEPNPPSDGFSGGGGFGVEDGYGEDYDDGGG